jgi:ArsR family transcriptional regulator, arsenate/arsenite/antimonite-responsive transcriptional repressor
MTSLPASSSPEPASAGEGGRLDRQVAETYARWFHALSDPTRIIILSYLARQPEPLAVGTIVENLALGQSTVSHHLRVLHEVGFVTRKRVGTNRLYTVNPSCLTQFPVAAEVVMGKPAAEAC